MTLQDLEEFKNTIRWKDRNREIDVGDLVLVAFVYCVNHGPLLYELGWLRVTNFSQRTGKYAGLLVDKLEHVHVFNDGCPCEFDAENVLDHTALSSDQVVHTKAETRE